MKNTVLRKTGRAYRRAMLRKHTDARKRIILRKKYDPRPGHLDWKRVDGVWQPVGKYIKYPKNSRNQRFWKRHSNRIVRKTKEIYKGNQYRKCSEYAWMLL